MAYEPTEFDDSPNVPARREVWQDFAFLIVGTLAGLIVLYWLMGFAVDIAADRITAEQEMAWFGGISEAAQNSEKNIPANMTRHVAQAFAKIPDNIKPDGYKYRVFVTDDDTPNAFAFPGGGIAITSGMLKKLPSENALLFVLGHELGHFANRDHLRGMGRSLLMQLAQSLIFDGNSISSATFDGLSLNYSRDQEHSADLWGLRALMAVYGHAGGSVEFFEHVLKNEDLSWIEGMSSTHPISQERIKHLNNRIEAQKFPVKATMPLLVE